ncbi:MAG: aminotransferase class III-fold pyridoxal phosphate-dependent enzyme [Anaerovoracaceae bacterium]
MSNIKEKSLKYNLHSWSAQGALNPKVITDAEGLYFYDDQGNKYADMSAQLVNSNLGHKNQAIIKAICDQAQKMPFMGPGFAIDVRSDAAEALVKLSGMKDAKVFFTNAGAEANENALKMARAYTGRNKIFSAYKSYHGSSQGAGMLTGDPRHFANEPGPAGFIKYDFPYAFRAPAACKFETEEDITNFYLELLDNQFQYEGPQNIAAIWLETVVGSNGILIPPKGYMEGVRALCDKYGILMVCDEVMAGFYRTGPAFAFMNFNIEPDLVVFAKGATCGYVPLGGVIVADKINKFFDANKMFCGLTYNAHVLGCATVVGTIKEYERLNIEENVKKQGKILAEILDGFVGKYKCVGEVRHIGLFSCIDMIKAPGVPIVPYGKDPEGMIPKIIGSLVSKGVWTYMMETCLTIAPPLIITEEQLRENMAKVEEVLAEVDAML